ncbi:MAG TPA: PTS sugar transporter subunit IIA [Burkholderiales bacterium]|nr:PTS sugar transporter subunit IIA [Burkholderiales bacterium]
MGLISSLLDPSHVALDVEATNKRELFERVAALLEGASGLSRSQVVGSLLARERLGSTGLGQGIAIPHGRVKGLRDAVGAFVRVRTPIAFDAPDSQPVNLAFVLLVPERATDLHLQILSELAQMFSDRELRRLLAVAPDAPSAQRLIVGWQAHTPNT